MARAPGCAAKLGRWIALRISNPGAVPTLAVGPRGRVVGEIHVGRGVVMGEGLLVGLDQILDDFGIIRVALAVELT